MYSLFRTEVRNQTFVRNYILSRCVILLYQVESESLTPAWYVLVARSPGRPSQNLSSIYRLFVSRTQNGTQTKRKIVFPLAALFVSWWISQQMISSFSSIFMASTRTKITFRSLCMYAKTYAGYIIPKGRVPVFFVPNSFWATKGHGRGRRSLVLSRDVGTSFLWFRSPWNNGTNWLCVWVASFK